ncbi:MAG: ring-cleaving dioxygenase [Rhodothermales bacterium]|nr:ring-cleaving dioxygenase [Rhodothermales bacterium]
MRISGIHHVTGIAGPAAKNVAFYTHVLGLRLVKRTINFDDPGTWHLYYGSETGEPGTILTFFPYEQARQGRAGNGNVAETSISVQDDALDTWLERFAEVRGAGQHGPFDFRPITERFGDRVLRFRDPNGLNLALVGRSSTPALGSFDGVTLQVSETEPTARLLEEVLGLERGAEEGARTRFLTGNGSRVDLETGTDLPRMGAGTIHHVAFRVANDEEQLAWRERVISAGIPVTEVKDRNYFRSIYFREPGGVLFEIATDPPGFTVDESVQSLGQTLKLPDWLEPHRSRIEQRLPSLDSVPA